MMTNRATNEAIAQWFEPKPEEPPTHAITSAKQFWVGEYNDSDRYGGYYRWVPRYAFDTDEAANAMLRYAMFVTKDTPELLEVMGEDRWITIQRDVYDYVKRRFDEGSNLANLFMEAWVRQFCRWAKIDAGGEA